MPLETLRILPDSVSRFGTISLGFDRVAALREEHVALLSIVAMVMGVTLESVTLSSVMEWQSTRHLRAGLVPPDQIEQALAAVEKALTADFEHPDYQRVRADAVLWLLAIGAR
jgi:hypothetical protein